MLGCVRFVHNPVMSNDLEIIGILIGVSDIAADGSTRQAPVRGWTGIGLALIAGAVLSVLCWWLVPAVFPLGFVNWPDMGRGHARAACAIKNKPVRALPEKGAASGAG